MGHMKMRIAAGAAMLATVALAGCGSPAESGEQSPSGVDGAAGEQYNILIAQLVTHPSLDESVAGFKAAFEEAGVNVKFQEENANGDQTVVASIAGSAASSEPDLILAVATPMAQGIAQKVSNTPILFTAVTDPVGAGLVESLEKPGANISGTSDANPVADQVELIKEFVPDAKTLGVVYNPGEANSEVQVEWVEEAASKLGLTVEKAGAVTSAEVQQAADSLAVDAIYIPTDNTVVSALDSVLAVGEKKGIPVFAAEGDSVAAGAVATKGLSYFQLGYQTGEMALRILKEGADVADMPVETQTDLLVYVNKGAAERMGVEVPESVLTEATTETTFE